jgi:hypothetical protein
MYIKIKLDKNQYKIKTQIIYINNYKKYVAKSNQKNFIVGKQCQ